MRILVVEDHAELRGAIARRLRALGHGVDEVGDGESMRLYLQEASRQQPARGMEYQAVVLDRMLPDGDAVERVRALRAAGDATPILFLTARDRIEDRVDGLEAGADDYLVKPFAMDELVARVGALARRRHSPRPAVLRIADLELDLGRRQARRAGVLIPLRAKELSLLELLAQQAGQVVSKAMIRESCWDLIQDPLSNVEEALVASLRRKLGKPSLIHTVRGAGYLLEGPNGSTSDAG